MILGLSVLLTMAGALGVALGLWVVRLDESQIIERAARAHVAEGGKAEECSARTGVAPVWIMVACGSGDRVVLRAFNRWGLQIPAEPGKGPGT